MNTHLKLTLVQMTFRVLRRIIYWVAPPILMFLILRRVDFIHLRQTAIRCNLWLVVLGICYYPLVTIVGSLRWRVAVAEFSDIRRPLYYFVRHYWIGMVLGVFSPGQIGLDVYRIAVVGRDFGRYIQLAFSIMIEKCMALLSAVALVVCLYPTASQFNIQYANILNQLVNMSYCILTAVIITGCAFAFFGRKWIMRFFLLHGSSIVARLFRRMRNVTDCQPSIIEAQSPDTIIALFCRTKPFLMILATSFFIQILSAIGSQIIFRAVGYDLPFVINLFVCPLFYFIFLLPISFGSIGIREGTYILLYGLFGVPMEVALLVSLLNLLGIMTNSAIGALFIWCSRSTRPALGSISH